MTQPKILYWDTETSPFILMSFGLYNQNHRYDDLYQDWFFICAQWMWEHEGKLKSVSVLDDAKRFSEDHTDDYYIVKTLYDLISQADIIVAHNNDGFDWKKFTAKIIEHKLPPIKYPMMIDTLKHAKIHGFTSNSLDSLTKKLSLSHKLTKNTGLWKKAAMGDKAAIRKIEKYGRGDIPALKALYKRLRPYMLGHPNMNQFANTKDVCPNCGSKHFQKRGTKPAQTNIYQWFQCSAKGCGKWFKGRNPIGKVNMR